MVVILLHVCAHVLLYVYTIPVTSCKPCTLYIYYSETNRTKVE
jgi:hypothetical protein